MKTCVIAIIASFLVSLTLGVALIPLLKRVKIGQSILSYVKEHEQKSGTPTMCGVCFIIPSIIVPILMYKGDDFRSLAVACSVGGAYGAVGFLDDFIKVKYAKNEGLKPYQKILFQLAIALIVSVYMLVAGKSVVNVPLFNTILDVKFLIIPLSIFVFVATTNCVNLTDGLDGLAGGVSVVYLACMAFIVLLQNEWDVNGMVVLSASLIGGLLGFLVFNVNKASVFMGDTGSLALGGFIASISMMSENVLFIPVVGVMFVVTGISVIAQVLYYKKTKRRIFLMAPLHHHFQMKGFTEAKIAYVYKLVTLFAGLFCVFTLI